MLVAPHQSLHGSFVETGMKRLHPGHEDYQLLCGHDIDIRVLLAQVFRADAGSYWG